MPSTQECRCLTLVDTRKHLFPNESLVYEGFQNHLNTPVYGQNINRNNPQRLTRTKNLSFETSSCETSSFTGIALDTKNAGTRQDPACFTFSFHWLASPNWAVIFLPFQIHGLASCTEYVGPISVIPPSLHKYHTYIKKKPAVNKNSKYILKRRSSLSIHSFIHSRRTRLTTVVYR